jgi:hypothetical protein
MIRARDLPEIRSRLLRHLATDAPAEWAGLVAGGADPAGLAAAEVRRVRASELFYVAVDMTAVAVAAGAAIPEFRLTPEDLPAPCGMLVWDRPGAGPVDVVAVTWGPGGNGDRPGVKLGLWVDADAVVAWHEAAGPGEWSTGQSGRGFPRDAVATPEERAEMRWRRLLYQSDAWLPWADEPDGWFDYEKIPERLDVARTLVATWLLMGQTIVSERVERTHPAERRRLARRGDPTGDVRYVALRRLTRGPDGEAAESRRPGSRHHRWWTRGHWRNQWYPSQDRHRPIWISPHVRGPEGAPLLHRETVHTLRR